jgi:hypothetical protein
MDLLWLERYVKLDGLPLFPLDNFGSSVTVEIVSDERQVNCLVSLMFWYSVLVPIMANHVTMLETFRGEKYQLSHLLDLVGEIRHIFLIHRCIESLFKARLSKQSVHIFKRESFGLCGSKDVSDHNEHNEHVNSGVVARTYQDRTSTMIRR